MTIGRVIGAVVVVLLAIFAWRGGIFSVSGYRELERDFQAAKVDSAHLRHEIDSLRAFRDSLQNNSQVQERVAREQWGMIRPGEISILINHKDSTKR